MRIFSLPSIKVSPFVEVVTVKVLDHDILPDLSIALRGPKASVLHQAWMRDRPQDYGAQVKARLEPGLAISGTEYVTSQQIRPKITRRFVDAVFAEADIPRANDQFSGAVDRGDRRQSVSEFSGRRRRHGALHASDQLSGPTVFGRPGRILGERLAGVLPTQRSSCRLC